MKNHLARDYNWLYKKYIVEQLPASEIAKLVGITKPNILRWLKKLDIPRRPPSESKLTLNYWNKMSGANNPNWTGGNRRISGFGYARVYCSDRNNPRRDKRGRVAEQLLVVEKALNRYLNPEEEIHHKNFNRQDNRLVNFIVFPNQTSHLKFHSYLQKIGAYHLGFLKEKPEYKFTPDIIFF